MVSTMAHPRRPIAKTSGGADVVTTSAIIVPDNPSRLALTITNNSDADVSLELATGSTPQPATTANLLAVVNEGIVLKANGGTWSTTSYTGPVAAITAGVGTKRVGVVEI